MNGTKVLEAINREIANGHTVYISTMYRHTPVNPKTAAKFNAAGYDLFKVDSKDSLYLRDGKRWDCIDFCKFTVAK